MTCIDAQLRMRGSAILFSEMTPDASWEDEFNDWYDHEHIPLRMAVPGFRSAHRYRGEGTRNYLVVYEMDSPAVLESPAYLAVKNNPSDRTRRMLKSVTGFTRYIAEETAIYTREFDQAKALDAPFLYSVFSDVPPQHQDDFRDGLVVRRFKIIDGEPKSWTHLALHYLKDASAVESVQFPWPTLRLMHHKHGSRQ
jgi:hypothetical protein